MAVAFAFTGWATSAASAAPPPPQASADSPVTVQATWIRWRVYSTYEKCAQAGRDFDYTEDNINGWRCTFDSPGWLLELRRAG